MNESILSERAPDPVGPYPHVKKVNNFLFLSGVGPRKKGSLKIPGVELDEDGKILSYDIEKQARSVFDNVKMILEDAGSSWDQLVDITVFLTNMQEDFDTFNKIYGDYFKGNKPARTTVEITALPTPIAIELKCVASTD